jgi:hypothetical protein
LTPADKLAAFEISDNRTTNTDTFCQIGLTPTKKCACAPYLRSEFRKIMHGYSKKSTERSKVDSIISIQNDFYCCLFVSVNQDQVVSAMSAN